MNVKIPSKKNQIYCLLLIVLVAFYLRLQGINYGQPYTGHLFVLLRFISVLFGVGTVLLTYLIGLLFNPFVGLFASAFLSVSYLHIKFSQSFLTLSPMIFFFVSTTYLALKFLITRNLKYFYLGLVSSLIGLSLNGFNPLKYLCKSYFDSYFEYHSSTFFLYLFNFLIIGVGPVVWASAFFLFRYKNNYNLSLLKVLFFIPILCLSTFTLLHITSVGYVSTLAPYVCLAAGLVFSPYYEEVKNQETSLRKLSFLLLLLFALFIPLKYTLKYNKIINLSDTRTIATEWIKDNSSSDYKIAWDKNSFLKELLPEEEFFTNKQRYNITSSLLNKKDWFKILRKKVDYVVIDSLDYEQVLRKPGKDLKKKYYKKLLKLKPVITFNPYLKDSDKHLSSFLFEELYSPYETLWQRERAGPVIRIYKL